MIRQLTKGDTMKKFSFIPYFDLLVILYYFLTFIIVMLFFHYVIISDQLYEEIDRTEFELEYSQYSQNDTITSALLEKLNTMKAKENEYMVCKLKYLFISTLMISLIFIDAKIYDRFKGKNCWYINLHKNCAYLHGNSIYSETNGD